MNLKVKPLMIKTGKPIIIINEADAKDLGVHASDRVKIMVNGDSTIAVIDITATFIQQGEIGIFDDIRQILKYKDGDLVDVKPTERPQSIGFIKKKMEGAELSDYEIKRIIQDIVDNKLTEIELSAFITGAYIRGYTMEETVSLTKAMIDTGEQIDFGDDVVDKHCIGGVAGNRTTMLIVPIITAFGMVMPKTSSRAITSPAGTADTMEVLANVTFTSDEIKNIVKKMNGCIVWGGSINLAPADDKMISVEHPLSIDPMGQLIASVLSKKKSIGSDYVVIDIPTGKGTKVSTIDEGVKLADKFIEVGKRLDMAIRCLITDGSTPIGRGVGPALEAYDVLMALEKGAHPSDLINKSLDMAGAVFEMAGKTKFGGGRKIAESILFSGKAKKKMLEIIEAQGGDPSITSDKIKDTLFGDKTYEVKSDRNGTVRYIDNRLISVVAIAAGAPRDKGAGVRINVHVGDEVETNTTLLTIYAENERKLDDAIRASGRIKPVEVGGSILKSIQ